MPKSNMIAADRRVHDLHMQGFPVTLIAKMTGRTESEARGVITGQWLEDKLAAKAAKQVRR